MKTRSKLNKASYGLVCLAAAAMIPAAGCKMTGVTPISSLETVTVAEGCIVPDPWQNQTSEANVALVNADPTRKGVCVFLVSAPEKGAGEVKATSKCDVTYSQCVEQGTCAAAFKFIAYDSTSGLGSCTEVLASGGGCTSCTSVLWPCTGSCLCKRTGQCYMPVE